MITNREEVIDKAFKVFLKMNYEKASISTLAKACGVVKTGVVYYFPHKLDLFMAVADKYAIQMQTPSNKFAEPAETLAEFIDQYIAGVENTMQRLVRLLDDGNNPSGCSFNFYYYHLLMQVRLYYPNVEQKIAAIFEQNHRLWKSAIHRAKENGEIRSDLDVEETALMFWQMFFGMSFEQSFLQGLDTKKLSQKLHFIYSLIKA
jgi:AcrR family transcriptional regulator